MHDRSAPPRVAIVGVACRLPGGASSLAAFWDVLRQGLDVTSTVPPDRWSKSWYGGPRARPGHALTERGAFIGGGFDFDASYFELAEDEAAALDPHHRLLLELSVEAVDDAGVPRAQLAGAQVGVFMGVSSVDQAGLVYRDVETYGPHLHTSKHY